MCVCVCVRECVCACILILAAITLFSKILSKPSKNVLSSLKTTTF